MGHPIGVFTEKQVKALSPRQRAALKKQALKHIRTSSEIRKIITANPKVRKILKKKLDPTYKRLTAKGY